MAPENSYRVTLLQSKAVSRADGQVAMALQTKELGLITFPVDAVAIHALRTGIADAEALLARSGQRPASEA